MTKTIIRRLNLQDGGHQQSCQFSSKHLYPILREIEAHGNLISEEGLKTGWFISSNIEDHIKNIERYIKLGFSNIHLQSSSPDEHGFIRTFGRKVLPYLRDAYREV